jgi:hypothetical protein
MIGLLNQHGVHQQNQYLQNPHPLIYITGLVDLKEVKILEDLYRQMI